MTIFFACYLGDSHLKVAVSIYYLSPPTSSRDDPPHFHNLRPGRSRQFPPNMLPWRCLRSCLGRPRSLYRLGRCSGFLRGSIFEGREARGRKRKCWALGADHSCRGPGDQGEDISSRCEERLLLPMPEHFYGPGSDGYFGGQVSQY